ncbi:MAG: hypothetical protein IAF94_22650, partial [Pirellulaceae bacterium]|nr:hypothetical protein [Pirellulaceae bacterium]
MPRFMENISTVNSFVRTVLAVVVLGGVGGGGWYAYYKYNAKEFEAQDKAAKLADATKKLQDAEADIAAKAKTIQENVAKISALNKDNEKLRTKLALLKVDHRLARLTVLDQEKRGEKDELYSKVEFVELNDEGVPFDNDPPRIFDIKGDLVYIDSLVVKFEDKYIEEKDLDRSTSLCIFTRIYGERQQPIEGFPLDRKGTRPTGYARGGRETEFERKIWDDFWNIANDDVKAK